MKKESNTDGNEVRSYETESQARQAWEDINNNGSCSAPSLEISGGDFDGTGGTYEVRSSKH
jgi:hypothetical protein